MPVSNTKLASSFLPPWVEAVYLVVETSTGIDWVLVPEANLFEEMAAWTMIVQVLAVVRPLQAHGLMMLDDQGLLV